MTAPLELPKIRDRLVHLINEGRSLPVFPKTTLISTSDHTRWRIKSETTLRRICFIDGRYLQEFTAHNGEEVWEVKNACAVLQALLDDLDDGHLTDVPLRLRAEVFTDFAEQAEYLLEQGYYVPAAVLLGAVLEDALRKLCERHSIELPPRATIDPMNQKLAKANVYGSVEQKLVLAWAGIRNAAAHGKASEIDEQRVRGMHQGVLAFIARYLV